MKKIIAVLLAAICTLSFALTAFAGEGGKQLKFNDDGKFTIMNICDIQDTYPMNESIVEFINEAIKEKKPDLVILGGDNMVCALENKDKGIEQMCNIFVENKTYFTLVFGNHDHQQGLDNDTQLQKFIEYGKGYCLAYDAVPELTGTGTHNLTILSSDGKKVAYNLYMFDSNTYCEDEKYKDYGFGYDAVHKDQIEWYKQTSAALKEKNGGEVVPAMAFQHIIVQEVYEKLFIESPVSLGNDLTPTFVDVDGTEHYFTYLPKASNIVEGFMLEHPCPGNINYGQLDAMVEVGDVKAIFSGHDHTNNFTINIDGINVTNTGGCTYNSYGEDVNRGCRIIVLDEKDLSTYETYTYTLAEQSLAEGSKINDFGDMTAVKANLAKVAEVLLNILVKFAQSVLSFVK